MNTFDESLHPRSHDGTFSEKTRSAPEAALHPGAATGEHTGEEEEEEAVLSGVTDALPQGHSLRDDPERLRAVALSVCEAWGGDELLATMERRNITPGDLGTAVARAVSIADKHGIAVTIAGDASWPAALGDMGDDAPVALWSKGDMSLLREKGNIVNFAGARASTGYGEHVATELAAGISDRGSIIASGGAYGIDAAATRAALAAGRKAVVVLPSGVERPYPSGHDELIRRVADRGGAVLSEVPPGMSPTRQRALRRNGVLAALSGVTVIVEAGPRSGSLHLAESASALGRKVLAVPGPITSAASMGTNELIASGHAQAVMSTEDIQRHMEY